MQVHIMAPGWCLLLLAMLLDICVNAEVYLNKFAVHISGGHNLASRVAREAGMINKGQIGSLDDHYLFEVPSRQRRSSSISQGHHDLLGGHEDVHWFEQQVVLKRKKRDFHPRDVATQMSVVDPYWKNQWYMHSGARGSYDMNVLEAWRAGYTGKNVVVAILDDGLERDHPDLIKNYDQYASYDLNDHDADPMPRYDPSNENRHGTRCAGEVSAEANNTACTIGVAPDSRIGGIRMLDGEVFDAVEAASLSHNRSHIDIYSASWGPDDDGKVVDGPGALAKKAFINGIEQGRGGKGSIFVWASGNGGSAHDSCNCDGYANSVYTMSISSTSENGVKPWYLEECSSTLATTYSSGAYNERQIASTDLRKRCTTTHTGTSASAPLAAGIVALVLEANPALTWRDLQYITLMTSRPDPITDGQWIVNGVGRKVSLRYGYGLMDAYEMVKLAKVWTTVPEKHECLVTTDVNNARLVKSPKFSNSVTTNGCQGGPSEVQHLEHVQVKVTLNYDVRGRVVIYLTSPSGTRSKVLPARNMDMSPGSFKDWPLLSVMFWGEDPRGTWRLDVEDSNPYGRTISGGTLETWSLVLHGSATQPIRLRNETQPGGQPLPPKVTVAPPRATSPPLTNSQSQACHAECVDQSECSGPTARDCTQCRNLIVAASRECVASCPVSHYVSQKTCQPCDPSCQTCSGPTLTECVTCYQGHHLHTLSSQHRICSVDCVEGFYFMSNSCLPCSSNCRACQASADTCSLCSDKDLLKDSRCVAKERAQSIIYEHMTLSIVLIAVLSLVAVLLGVAVYYAYSNERWCWGSGKQYGLVPREDQEQAVRLTYSDDIDDDFTS